MKIRNSHHYCDADEKACHGTYTVAQAHVTGESREGAFEDEAQSGDLPYPVFEQYFLGEGDILFLLLKNPENVSDAAWHFENKNRKTMFFTKKEDSFMKQKTKKRRNLRHRPLALLLALVMVVTMIPATALAADTGAEEHTITVVLEKPESDEKLALKYGADTAEESENYTSGTKMTFDAAKKNTFHITGLTRNDKNDVSELEYITIEGGTTGVSKITAAEIKNNIVANQKNEIPIPLDCELEEGKTPHILIDLDYDYTYKAFSFVFEGVKELNKDIIITIHMMDKKAFSEQKESAKEQLKALSEEGNDVLQAAINAGVAAIDSAEYPDALKNAIDFSEYAVQIAKTSSGIVHKSRDTVYLDKQTAVVMLDKTLELKAYDFPEDSVITWKSSDETVATVKNGVVSPVSEGFAIISASAGGKEASCAITVSDVANKKITMNIFGNPVKGSWGEDMVPKEIEIIQEEWGEQYKTIDGFDADESKLSYLVISVDGKENKKLSYPDVLNLGNNGKALVEDAFNSGGPFRMGYRGNVKSMRIYFETGSGRTVTKNIDVAFNYLDASNVTNAISELKAYKGRDEFREEEQAVYDTIINGAAILMNQVWVDAANAGNTQHELQEELFNNVDFLEMLLDGLKTDAEYTSEENFASAQALINALDSSRITLADEAQVQAARAAYDKLTADQKKQIQGYDKLTQAEKKIADLKAESDKPAVPEQKPSVTLEQQTKPEVEPAPTVSETKAQKSAALNSRELAAWSKDAIKVTWGKVKDADGYDIFMKKCDGESFTSKNIVKTVKKASVTSATIKKLGGKKLNARAIYKVKVRAWQKINGKKKYIADGYILHLVSKDHKTKTNPKSLTVSNAKKNALTVNAGKSKMLKVKVAKENSRKKLVNHVAKFRYFSTNTDIVKVSKSGKITAKKAGKCAVCVVAENGVKKKISVTVK